MNINICIIGGNLTRDPELKALPSGIKVASFSIAVNKVFKDKSGAKQQSTEYINIVVFGNQAEASAQYLKKGQTCFVTGRLQTRKWDKPDGSKGYKTDVIADRVQFGPRGSPKDAPPGDNIDSGDIDIKTGAKTPTKAKPSYTEPAVEYPTEDINPDDIPF